MTTGSALLLAAVRTAIRDQDNLRLVARVWAMTELGGMIRRSDWPSAHRSA